MNILDNIARLNAQRPALPRDIPEEMAHVPPRVWMSDLATQQRIEADQRAEDEERHQAAIRIAKEAAEQEYAQSLYAKTEHYRDQEPPSAEDLGVSIKGLQPARAMLVRAKAWLDRTTGELAKLEAAKERYLTDLGAPAISEAELAKLEQTDRSGFLAWLRSGAAKDTRPAIDEFRRQAVQTRLAEQTYAAQVARDGLANLEGDIEVLRKAAEILEARLPRYAQAVLAEDAAPLLDEYRAAVERVRALAADLAGLAHTAPAHGVYQGAAIRQVNIDVPAFGGVRRIVVHEAEVQSAAAPWRERERALIADPRACNTRKDKT